MSSNALGIEDIELDYKCRCNNHYPYVVDANCVFCGGVGWVMTTFGTELVDFLRRHKLIPEAS